MVIVISAKNVTLTNVSTADENCPIYAENLNVHILTDGCSIDLLTGKLTQKADC